MCIWTTANAQYIKPMDINILLSGTFGELRTNHYHSGIDIKTGGRIGIPVKSIADGEIVRIAVSPSGFGNALYINHPDGKTSVYAHLHEFSSEIADYVLKEQYRLQKFKVNLFPPKGKFIVTQGEIIAKSGNSGSSGGPHLHFEIRDTRTEEPLSPIRAGIPVSDNKAPEYLRMAIYNSNFEYEQDVALILLGNNRYRCEGGTISIPYNPFSLGFKVYDRQEGTRNSNGVEHLEVAIDGEPVFNWQFDRMNFNETRYCNATQDITTRKRLNSIFHRAHNMPGNKTKFSNLSGLIRPSNGSVIKMKSTSWDHNDNTSVCECTFKVNGSTKTLDDDYLRQGVPHTIKKKGFEMYLPANALYTNISGKVTPIKPRGISNAYTFLDMHQAFHKHATIKIEANNIPYEKRSKVIAAEQNYKGRTYYEKGKWEKNWFIFRTRSSGRWWLEYDEEAPTIRPSASYSGRNFSKGNTLKFIVKDQKSGINQYNAFIDNKWVLMEYDAKRDLMSVPLDKIGFPRGKHTLSIQVTDHVGNNNSLEFPITIK